MTNQQLEKLKAEKPEGATIVAVKADRVTYFKEDGKDRLLTFNRTMWVKTWFTPFHMNLKHFALLLLFKGRKTNYVLASNGQSGQRIGDLCEYL